MDTEMAVGGLAGVSSVELAEAAGMGTVGQEL